MTSAQAKTILARFRGNSADASEPDVIEALGVTKTDWELASWWTAQQQFHAEMSAALQVPVPAGLREAILRPEPKIIPFWKRPENLAIAASIILLIAAAAFWLTPQGGDATFANFRQRMSGFALRTYKMDVLSTNAQVVRAHLASRQAPSDFPLPPGLAQLPVQGGGRLAWRNHPVSMICFTLPNNETLYMFVMDQSAVKKGASPAPTPELTTDRLTTAAWTSGGRVYLVAAAMDAQTLKNYVDQ